MNWISRCRCVQESVREVLDFDGVKSDYIYTLRILHKRPDRTEIGYCCDKPNIIKSRSIVITWCDAKFNPSSDLHFVSLCFWNSQTFILILTWYQVLSKIVVGIAKIIPVYFITYKIITKLVMAHISGLQCWHAILLVFMAGVIVNYVLCLGTKFKQVFQLVVEKSNIFLKQTHSSCFCYRSVIKIAIDLWFLCLLFIFKPIMNAFPVFHWG